MIHFNHLLFVLATINISGAVTTAQGLLRFDEIIVANPNLTTFNVSLVNAKLNLSDVFTSPVTVFAPDNTAFALYTDLIIKYSDEQYIAHLRNILLTHVIKSKKLSNTLINGQKVSAVNLEVINVAIGATIKLNTANNDAATVVVADVESTDGVLHQIDGVLLPSFVQTGILDLIESTDGFSICSELLQYTGLYQVFQSEQLTATFFAPTDAAFEALPDGVLDYYRSNLGIATILLTGHILSPQILPTQNMINGTLQYQTPGGNNLTIEILDFEGTMIYKVNNARILAANILANNGIIHMLSSVLTVPGTMMPVVPVPVDSCSSQGGQIRRLLCLVRRFFRPLFYL